MRSARPFAHEFPAMPYTFASRQDAQHDSQDDVVGIVVRNRVFAAPAARTLTFVWGPEVQAPPSLPFGRWKRATRAA